MHKMQKCTLSFFFRTSEMQVLKAMSQSLSCELSLLVSYHTVTHSSKHFIYLPGEYLSFFVVQHYHLPSLQRKLVNLFKKSKEKVKQTLLGEHAGKVCLQASAGKTLDFSLLLNTLQTFERNSQKNYFHFVFDSRIYV